MDEASGDRSDSFGGHTLQNNGVPSVAGKIGNAGSFVVSDTAYLLHLNTSTLATGDIDFSFSSWFYLTTTGEYTILSKQDGSFGEGNTVLLLHCDGVAGSTTFSDSSVSGNTVTSNSGAVIDTNQFKFGGAAGLLVESSGSFLSVASSNDFYFGTSDMTIDFWLRLASAPGAGGSSAGFGGCRTSAADYWGIRYDNNSLVLEVVSDSLTIISIQDTPGALSIDTWYHIALVKQGTGYTFFIDGESSGATKTDANEMPNVLADFVISPPVSQTMVPALDGHIEEYRVLKGKAAWTGNFTPETAEYAKFSQGSEKEYWLGVEADNVVKFEVSSSGTAFDGSVSATSFGAVSTATWYNVVAWHDTGNTLGVSLNLSTTTASYASGVRSGSAPFVMGAVSNGSDKLMDGRVDETGFWKRLLTDSEKTDLYNSGNANSLTDGFEPYIWGAFDFGASDIRWLTVAAGTGLYASSNLGVDFTEIGTSQSATYNNFERSKNVLVVTTDAYDPVVRWDGSGGTFATLMNPSAPTCKYAINHQGFLVLLNSNTRKRLFSYEDANTQLTGDWGDDFDLPSSQDDEITGAVVLRRNLYVSTKFKIFRVSYVGGNPDWSFTEIKDWGFVPRTIKKISLKDIGEVVVGMSWDRRVRIFDGADDKIVSDNVEADNKICDYAMSKISFAGSGLDVSHAVVDDNAQVYKLNVAIGASTTNTSHILNLDGRDLSFYPYQNQPWQTMVMAESANERFLLAGDRSGIMYLLDSGNLDKGVTPIDDVLDSPLIFDKSPSEVAKSFKADLYFTPTSANTVYYLDRNDFTNDFKVREMFDIVNTGTMIQAKKSIDVPTTFNTYQYRITSSSGTSDPWEFNRIDYFVDGKGIGDNP
jgi:hypothetical protein